MNNYPSPLSSPHRGEDEKRYFFSHIGRGRKVKFLLPIGEKMKDEGELDGKSEIK
ncbi:MAG: hypothetical protein PHE88_02755 [Elusimicrobia bacterium]|nr:hypothetical protein [Elusimicrobiota bacterium]